LGALGPENDLEIPQLPVVELARVAVLDLVQALDRGLVLEHQFYVEPEEKGELVAAAAEAQEGQENGDVAGLKPLSPGLQQ
jgi:hypothetical protein